MTLRTFIDNRKDINTLKVNTFCRLMKAVSDALEKETRNIVRVNLDDIRINYKTGEIVFPDALFQEDFDKTISGIGTGVSLIADRKSSIEHKRVSFALMVLGWYCNPDHTSVYSDMEVLENFDLYMNKVPEWLQDYFIAVFVQMNYDITFGDYYQKNYIDKVKSEMKDAFAQYNLSEEQLNRIYSIVAKRANKMIKEGVQNV